LVLKGKGFWVAVVAIVVLAFGLTGCAGDGDGGNDKGQGQAGARIIGIDPGAGIMSATEKAIEEYNLNVALVEGSDATMTAALQDAINREEWIIVTGWSPHWKFSRWDLKYLEDPKGIFGGDETIETVARLGLAEDMPEVYALLEKFSWTDAEIGAVMAMNMEGGDPAENARIWVDENQALVQRWLPDEELASAEKGDVTILYVEWECATASTHVVKAVLEDLGYNVEVKSVAAALMWQGLAQGDGDFCTTAWLPLTHGQYLEEFGDQVDIVNTNYEGARIGLVVPSYVEIDSIEEINDNMDKFTY